ncbi:MAG: hypothetical protein WEA11_02395 [Acidimicrobiales bacterium]
MKRNIFIVILLASAVSLLGAACGSSSDSDSATASSSMATTPPIPDELSGWVGSLCDAITPSANALVAASKAAEASGSTSDITTVLTSTSALLTAVSREMVSLGAPPIDGGAVMVAEYPKGIAQAVATVNSAAASVQNGSISSMDQIGSIDVDSSLSPEATKAWSEIESAMGDVPKCQTLKDTLS